MLRCFFIRRKLYDYLDSSLSEVDRVGVKEHLSQCPACRKKLNDMARVLSLVTNKSALEPSEDFWRDFKAGLDLKIDAIREPEYSPQAKRAFNFRPALAYASALVFILALGLYVSFSNKPMALARQDLSLANEVELLEELSDSAAIYPGEEGLIEEISIINQLDNSSA